LKSPEWTVDDLVSGTDAGNYYIDQSIEEDAAEYEKIVATEWFKVTRGRSDPDLLATVFLTIAAGMPPTRSLLMREARLLIEAIRAKGFDSAAVTRFIQTCAPVDNQVSLLHMWNEDLLPEAEEHLPDPGQTDFKMVHALNYLRENCNASWSRRGNR
jgi:hypothetical protein